MSSITTKQSNPGQKIADLHLDTAALALDFGFGVEDFFSPESAAPVTLHKLRNAHVALAGFSLFCDPSRVESSYYDLAKKLNRFYESLRARCPQIRQINSQGDLAALGADEIGYMLTIEGCECLRRPEDWDEFCALGVRSVGLTWDNDNQYACGRPTKADTGLSEAGRLLLKRIEQSTCAAIDLSHLSPKSIKDVASAWTGPLYASHANAQSVWNNPHNLSDEEISLIVERKGIIGLFFYGACTGENNSFEDLWRHIEFVRDRWGLEYIGFSSDIYPLPQFPFLEGRNDVSIWEPFVEFLKGRMTDAEVEAVLYSNWQRFFQGTLPAGHSR